MFTTLTRSSYYFSKNFPFVLCQNRKNVGMGWGGGSEAKPYGPINRERSFATLGGTIYSQFQCTTQTFIGNYPRSCREWHVLHTFRTHTTDNKTNRWSSAYMSLSASYFAAPLVAVRLNYRTVTNSCVFTGHFIQNILHFGTIQILLFISDELFLCITFPKCNLDIYVVIFLSALDSTISTCKCLVTCDLLRVTESHCC